jgi:hypothetical protein
MKTKMIYKLSPPVILAIFTLLLSACATGSNAQPSTEATLAPAVESIEPWDGDGMDIPLDGTSLEAFDKSLARVKAHTTPESYTTLVNAIDYLLVYDLATKGDKATLVTHLDGMTGKQVVDQVQWRK